MNFNHKKMIGGISIMLLFSSLTMWGMGNELKIRTNDMQESEFFSVEKNIAEQVKCIAATQDFEGEVYLPNISKKTFDLVYPYLKLLSEQKDTSQCANCVYKRIISQKVSFEHVIELINAADYLSCEPLAEACAAALAYYGLEELKTIDASKQITIETILLKWRERFAGVPATLSPKIARRMFVRERLFQEPILSASLRKELKKNISQIHKVTYSVDKQLLAGAVSQDGYVYVWDVATGQKIHTLSTQKRPVETFCFSPNKEWLAIALSDQTISLWNLKQKKRRTLEMDHQADIISLSFSPNSQELVSCSSDNIILRWGLDVAKVYGISRRDVSDTRCNGYVKYDSDKSITTDFYGPHEQFINRFILAHPKIKKSLKTADLRQALLYVWIEKEIEKNPDKKIDLYQHPIAKKMYQKVSKKNKHAKKIFDHYVVLEKPSFLNTCTIS